MIQHCPYYHYIQLTECLCGVQIYLHLRVMYLTLAQETFQHNSTYTTFTPRSAEFTDWPEDMNFEDMNSANQLSQTVDLARQCL